MKKFSKIASILGAAVMGVSATGIGVVSAADTETAPVENSRISTKADVGLDFANPGVTLKSAPNISFGKKNKINGQKLDIQSVGELIPLKVDNQGVETGWDVKVSRSSFTTKDNKKLKGEALGIASMGKDEEITATDPDNGSGKPTVDPNGALVTGDQISIFTAKAGDGLGEWNRNFRNDRIHLSVPDGNSSGEYTSDLTWELSNTPK